MTVFVATDAGLVVNEIVEEALSLAGIGAEGESVTAEMQRRALRSLNLIFNTWSAAEHLWTQTEADVTLVSGQADYDLPGNPTRVRSIRRRVISSEIDTPMNEMSRQEYYDTPNKTGSPSTPVSFYFDPQAAAGTLFVWPAPASTVASSQQLKVTYLRRLSPALGSGATPDIPVEWTQALTYALAKELSLKYGVAPDIRAEIRLTADALYADLKGWDNESASIFLQPDYRWQ